MKWAADFAWYTAEQKLHMASRYVDDTVKGRLQSAILRLVRDKGKVGLSRRDLQRSKECRKVKGQDLDDALNTLTEQCMIRAVEGLNAGEKR